MSDYQYQSENVADLMKALAKAQAKIQNIGKASTNPHFKSSYADMAAVRAATYEALTSEGVTLLQPAEVARGEVTVTTELWFGEQWKRCPITLAVAPNNIHAVGSAITYAKRYGVTSMLSLAATDEDDDGNAASTGNGRRAAPAGAAITASAAEELRQAIVEVNADLPRFLKAFGINRLEELPGARFSEAMRMLEMKRQQGERDRATRDAAGQPIVTEDGEVIE